jgi:hypothetical protein
MGKAVHFILAQLKIGTNQKNGSVRPSAHGYLYVCCAQAFEGQEKTVSWIRKHSSKAQGQAQLVGK